MKAMCIDIGGTAMKYAMFDGDDILYNKECPSDGKKGGSFVLANIDRILSENPGFDCIGLSSTGQVDSDTGIIIYANDNVPGYINTPLKTIYETKYQVPVYVENDVNAAALGEAAYGAGVNENNFLMLTFGTGVGGAIIIDRQLYKGSCGVAAEFGHMITHPNGLLCACGAHGCYEQYASTTALVREASRINPLWNTGRQLFADMASGDIKALEIIDNWITEICYGLVNQIYTFNPSCIVLGGGVMTQNYVITKIRGKLSDMLIESFRDIAILPASLGNLAGVYGMNYLCYKV